MKRTIWNKLAVIACFMSFLKTTSKWTALGLLIMTLANAAMVFFKEDV